jgi:hypothetical protein
VGLTYLKGTKDAMSLSSQICGHVDIPFKSHGCKRYENDGSASYYTLFVIAVTPLGFTLPWCSYLISFTDHAGNINKATSLVAGNGQDSKHKKQLTGSMAAGKWKESNLIRLRKLAVIC